MNPPNYGRMMDQTLAALEESGERPTLLLHACCAPCSSHTLLFLHGHFRITLYFYNPNIAPEEEYEFRKSELKRLVGELGLEVPVIDADYDPTPFYALAKGLEGLPERSERCRSLRRCLCMRPSTPRRLWV